MGRIDFLPKDINDVYIRLTLAEDMLYRVDKIENSILNAVYLSHFFENSSNKTYLNKVYATDVLAKTFTTANVLAKTFTTAVENQYKTVEKNYFYNSQNTTNTNAFEEKNELLSIKNIANYFLNTEKRSQVINNRKQTFFAKEIVKNMIKDTVIASYNTGGNSVFKDYQKIVNTDNVFVTEENIAMAIYGEQMPEKPRETKPQGRQIFKQKEANAPKANVIDLLIKELRESVNTGAEGVHMSI